MHVASMHTAVSLPVRQSQKDAAAGSKRLGSPDLYGQRQSAVSRFTRSGSGQKFRLGKLLLCLPQVPNVVFTTYTAGMLSLI